MQKSKGITLIHKNTRNKYTVTVSFSLKKQFVKIIVNEIMLHLVHHHHVSCKYHHHFVNNANAVLISRRNTAKWMKSAFFVNFLSISSKVMTNDHFGIILFGYETTTSRNNLKNVVVSASIMGCSFLLLVIQGKAMYKRHKHERLLWIHGWVILESEYYPTIKLLGKSKETWGTADTNSIREWNRMILCLWLRLRLRKEWETQRVLWWR